MPIETYNRGTLSSRADAIAPFVRDEERISLEAMFNELEQYDIPENLTVKIDPPRKRFCLSRPAPEISVMVSKRGFDECEEERFFHDGPLT